MRLFTKGERKRASQTWGGVSRMQSRVGKSMVCALDLYRQAENQASMSHVFFHTPVVLWHVAEEGGRGCDQIMPEKLYLYP